MCDLLVIACKSSISQPFACNLGESLFQFGLLGAQMLVNLLEMGYFFEKKQTKLLLVREIQGIGCFWSNRGGNKAVMLVFAGFL